MGGYALVLETEKPALKKDLGVIISTDLKSVKKQLTRPTQCLEEWPELYHIGTRSLAESLQGQCWTYLRIFCASILSGRNL